MSQPPPIAPAEAVLRFLGSVGPGSEAEFYLRLFRERSPERFATVAVLSSAVEHGLEAVALDLRFLRELGLTPVVVLGLYEPELAQARADALGAHLKHAGVATTRASTDSDLQQIAQATRRGSIPLLEAVGGDTDQRVRALGRLLSTLRSHKLVLLRAQGGLKLHAEPLNVVNLSTDYSRLHAESEWTDSERVLLDDIQRLIFELVQHRLQVSLTSPLDLLRELFTVKGAGTLLRRGVSVTRHRGYQGADIERLRALLESSFARALRPGFFERAPEHAYVEQDYRGAALVERGELGGYLSKFAVTREAQGEGIGQDLWGALTADYPALYWRARRNNPIAAWYERHCQARYQQDNWVVYLRGIPADHVGAAVQDALGRSDDFV